MVHLVMGGLFVLAAAGGLGALGVAFLAGERFDLKTIGLALAGAVGAVALGYGFIHSARVPLLTVRPDALVVPTFFGRREIEVGPGHPVGEFIASSKHGGGGAGTIEERKFSHFYTLDGAGRLVELVALHRAAPMIPEIRAALRDVAGLEVEELRRAPGTRQSRPDVAHWRHGG